MTVERFLTGKPETVRKLNALVDAVKSLQNINFSGILQGVGAMIGLLFTIAVVGGVLALVLYKKKQVALDKESLHFFEEVNGQMIPIEDVKAREITIPGSNIRIFYIKSKDLYMPRGVKKMGKNSYWYAIRNNRELVNFIMKNLNNAMVEANLEFDHTDMRYAYANLREIIKRNYRNKSTKWWQEYKDVISIVIYVFVLTLSFIFIISKTGGLLDKIAVLIDKLVPALEIAMKQCGGATASGIVSA